MAADTVDSYHLRNAYTNGPKFDVPVRRERFDLSMNGHQDETVEADIPMCNTEVNMKDSPSRHWEPDVSGLISARKWLNNFGLKKNRLDIQHLLPAMGFQLSEDFDFTLKKPVTSKYGNGLFNQAFRPDGKTFNITADKAKLRVLEARLMQAILLYRRRLEWLTTESRRIFGVIEEKCVVIVLDIRNLSPQQFDQYRCALERVLREQVSQLTKFNIIRAAEDVEMYNKDCLPVTHDTLEGAVEWVWNLNRLAAVSRTATCEAVVAALMDRNAEAVYLFTEGAAVDGSREILKEKIVKLQKKTPVHVVSYNCTDSDTIHYLRELSRLTAAKFHAYAVTMEMDVYESLPVNPKNSRANVVVKRRTYGGVPSGAGVREDVFLVFEELEAARGNLDKLRAVIKQLPDPKFVLQEIPLQRSVEKSKIEKPVCQTESREEYLSSSEWLKTYGLSPQKLGLYDILAGVVFKHQDGVISVLEKPCHPHQTDAVSREKLVNARYCDRFPVVRWKDDCLVHVQVSPDIHRNYEQKMNTALHKIQQRIDWLKQGSRELFGTVLEEKIYILVDTSSSMVPHMQFVKDKLYLLLQEQLRHKMKFNLVSFNSRCSSWRDRLMDVTEPNLQSAWAWIQGLTCQGSTNTYAALQAAMGDNQTQAIYLLTDGRPDQPPKSVIAQVQMQNRVPIHTISFNCNDVTANQFLCSLANTTKGRFHYFNETGVDIDIPEKYESEDIHLLKKEYDEGLRQLEKVRELRDQCASLAWNQERDSLRKSSNGSRSSVSSSLQRRSLASDPTPRPRSAPPRDAQLGPALSARPSTALGTYSQPTPSQSPRISAKFSRRPPTASNNKTTDRPPNKAAHTRTSLLRTLSSSGRFTPDTWLLPETKEILNRQASRQTDKTKKLEDVEVPEEYQKFRDILEPRGLTAGTKVTKRARKKLNKKQSLGRDADLTVKQWLGRHGLAARKLTILDALAPTMVPHRAKYVPILDKHVLAKVFNNVLPLAHVSGRDQKQIQLINPNAVNLVEYEDRLQEAVTLYIQKLDQVVWDAIPQAARTELESEEPVSFLDNKIKMMRLLKEASWPVSSRDISLLEAEITRAEKFLQQSRDLRRVAKDHQQREPPAKLPGHNTQDLETSIDSAKVNESSRDKLSDVEEETRTGADSERTDGATERTDGAPEKDDADVYEDQASVVSSIAREQEAEAELQEKESLANEKKKDGVSSRRKRVSPGVRNQRVIARREADGLYYTGSVVSDEGDRTVRVEFDDWEGEVVPARYTIPISGAVACPLLRVGDYVLVRVMNTETDSEVYIPGVVQVTPQRVTDSTKFYTVLTYNAQRVTTMRNHMIKMTKVRFELCCRYIRQKLVEDISEKKYTVVRKGKTPVRDSHKERSVKEPGIVRPGSPVPDSDKEDGQEDVIDDLRHRLEDQQDIIEDQERELRHHRDKIAKLKKKQRRMKTTETALEKLFLKKEKLSAAADDVSDDESTPPELISLRRSLDPIANIGEEVLARWPDDGWYYRGTVLGGHKGQYVIEDCGQSKEDIWRENIITDADCAHHLLKVSDAVVAAHPDFCFSYAPGRVIDIQDQAIMVQFYDGQNATVPSDEVYCLHTEKYQHDVTYIQKCDTGRVGQPVIARDDKTGYFQPGFIEEKVGDKSQFIVRWRDGSSTLQKTMYIFGKFLKRYRLEVGERVLALADRSKDVYLPGLIKHKQGTQLTVKFCDGSVGDVDGDSLDCFWMAETFYDDAVLFYRSKSGKTDLS